MIDRSRTALWQEVLNRQIDDAIEGVRGSQADKPKRIAGIKAAREYLTTPSKDLELVCTFAGIDPDALIDRMQAKIKAAPAPEELTASKARHRVGQMLTFNGETLTVIRWAERLGLTSNLICSRLKRGWPIERVLGKPTPKQVAGVGVVLNFGGSLGTGAGRNAQDRTNISFSELEREAS